MGLLEEIDNRVFGGKQRRDKRTKELHEMKLKKMQSFVDSQQMRTRVDALRLQAQQEVGKLAKTVVDLEDIGAKEAAEVVRGTINELTGVKKQLKANEDRGILSQFFSAGVKQIKGEGGPGTLASEKQVNKLEKSFATEAQKQGVAGREAELLYGELYDEEVGKRGFFRNDVLPNRKVTDNRGLFSFDGAVAPEAGKKGKEVKNLSELFQAPTQDFSEDTIPKTLPDLGIASPADQQTFQELEAQAPKLDLRQAYQASPEDFQKILKALRSGKTPNGKPFTMKDAIKLLQENI